MAFVRETTIYGSRYRFQPEVPVCLSLKANFRLSISRVKLIFKVNGMSSTNGTDIVLPMISQHNGQMITTGIVRKKSTPKMISAKRYFELYGQGDIRTQTFLKTLQQTLGDEHFETYEVN